MKLKSDYTQATGLTVVIPVYRSATTLPKLVARLAEVLPECATEYEVILICDGGQTDETWAAVCAGANQYPWLRGINLARRCGQHGATLVGLRAAQFDLTVTMDDDLQHPPEEIPLLLLHLRERVDLVYGRPADNLDGWIRNFTSRLIREVIKHLHGVSHARDITAFRAMRTNLRDRFRNPESSFVLLDLVLAWVTTRILSVPVRFDRRAAGKSTYSPVRRLSLGLTLTATYSPHSLRLMSLLPVAWTILALGAVASGIFTYYCLPLKEGTAVLQIQTTTLIAGVGIQLLLLLAIGGLVAKIYVASIGVPQAIIQETINLRQ